MGGGCPAEKMQKTLGKLRQKTPIGMTTYEKAGWFAVCPFLLLYLFALLKEKVNGNEK